MFVQNFVKIHQPSYWEYKIF